MKDKIIDSIKKHVLTCEENYFPEIGGNYFDEPVIRFASWKDPLFVHYKTLIGDIYKTPEEAYEASCKDGGKGGRRGAGSVISVLLPIAEGIRKSNRPQKDWPSQNWAIARARFEEVYISIGRFIEDLLKQMGHRGIIPRFASWNEIVLVQNRFAAAWSERHAAYAAGHGTFSLNDGFITEKGIAVRFISAVTDMELEPDARLVSGYNSNCLHYAKGICGACVKRCPSRAIDKNGNDKVKCYQRCYGEESQKLAVSYGGTAKAGAGCGLCQTGVPCEYENPVK